MSRERLLTGDFIPTLQASSVPEVPSGREAASPRRFAEGHPSHTKLDTFSIAGETEFETHRPLTTL